MWPLGGVGGNGGNVGRHCPFGGRKWVQGGALGTAPPQAPTVCPSGAGPCPPTWGSPRAIALPRASGERPGRSGRPALSARPLQDVTSSLTGRLGPRPTDRAGKVLPAPGLRMGTSAPVPTSASAGASPGGPGRAGPPGPRRPPAWALGRRPTPGEGVQEGEEVGGTRPGSRKQTHPEEAAGKGAAGRLRGSPPPTPPPAGAPAAGGGRGLEARGPLCWARGPLGRSAQCTQRGFLCHGQADQGQLEFLSSQSHCPAARPRGHMPAVPCPAPRPQD